MIVKRNMNKIGKIHYSFGDIVIWLIIFVVGSLIVTFLISPNSFQSFKNNFASLKSTPSSSNSYVSPELDSDTDKQISSPPKSEPNIVKINATERCSTLKGYGYTKSEFNMLCSSVCSVGANPLISTYGPKLGYDSYECVNDKLICNCIP